MMSEAHCSRTDMFAKMVTIWKREWEAKKMGTPEPKGALYSQRGQGLQSFPLACDSLLSTWPILPWYFLSSSWAPAPQMCDLWPVTWCPFISTWPWDELQGPTGENSVPWVKMGVPSSFWRVPLAPGLEMQTELVGSWLALALDWVPSILAFALILNSTLLWTWN